jgi:hypothetical protein
VRVRRDVGHLDVPFHDCAILVRRHLAHLRPVDLDVPANWNLKKKRSTSYVNKFNIKNRQATFKKKGLLQEKSSINFLLRSSPLSVCIRRKRQNKNAATTNKKSLLRNPEQKEL